MKRTIILLSLVFLTLAAACQSKDKVFNSLIRFNMGIQFGDGTIQATAATGTGTVTWDAVSGKPLTFPPVVHNHDALYRGITWVPTWGEVTGKPATFAPAVHTQAWSTIIGTPITLAGYGITDAASLIHTHSLLYKPLDYVPTWNEILSKPIFATVATTGSFTDLVNVPDFMELEVALPSLPGIKLPVLTQTQINALVPVKGLLLFNDTDGVLQIYTGTVWKVVATTNQ